MQTTAHCRLLKECSIAFVGLIFLRLSALFPKYLNQDWQRGPNRIPWNKSFVFLPRCLQHHQLHACGITWVSNTSSGVLGQIIIRIFCTGFRKPDYRNSILNYFMCRSAEDKLGRLIHKLASSVFPWKTTSYSKKNSCKFIVNIKGLFGRCRENVAQKNRTSWYCLKWTKNGK